MCHMITHDPVECAVHAEYPGFGYRKAACAHHQGYGTSGRLNAVAAPDTAKETVPASICVGL